jgi:hypothetical protein
MLQMRFSGSSGLMGRCLLPAACCLLLLSCSSTSGQAEGDPKSPKKTVSENLGGSATGEFYDLFDVPRSHPLRPAVGLLLWSGVPLEDDEGNLKPDAPLLVDDFLVWALAAANRPLTAGAGLIPSPSVALDLRAAARKTAEAEGLIAPGAASGPIDDRAAQEIAQKLASGAVADHGYPWYTPAADKKGLTRIEGCRLLAEALRPEAKGFSPDRGDAALLLYTGKFWDSVWDARIEKVSPYGRAPASTARHKGITIESLKPPEPGRYGTEAFISSVRYLKDLGADSIAVIPYARLMRFDLPSILWGAGAGYPRAALERSIRSAKAEGMRVILKPHLWLSPRPENEGQWTGSTQFSDEGWREYLSRYRSMVLTYAEISSRAGADLVVIGTEMKTATKGFPEFFTRLIGEIRAFYPGEITYAANHDEFQRIPFWGALDYVGVDAYYELSEERSPSVEQIKAGWAGPKEELMAAAKASGRRVLFLEAGYKPKPYALKAPWEWRSDKEEDQGIQEAAYRALFESFWGEEWFAGVYFWKYFSDLSSSAQEAKAEQFVVYKKKAEQVIREYYGKP